MAFARLPWTPSIASRYPRAYERYKAATDRPTTQPPSAAPQPMAQHKTVLTPYTPPKQLKRDLPPQEPPRVRPGPSVPVEPLPGVVPTPEPTTGPQEPVGGKIVSPAVEGLQQASSIPGAAPEDSGGITSVGGVGALRPLGQRIPPGNSMALAGLRRIY